MNTMCKWFIIIFVELPPPMVKYERTAATHNTVSADQLRGLLLGDSRTGHEIIGP